MRGNNSWPLSFQLLSSARAPGFCALKAILPILVVDKGFVDLLLRVHDKRSVLNDRFLDRLAGNNHKVCILVLGLDPDCVCAILREDQCVVSLVLKPIVIDVCSSFEHINKASVRGRDCLLDGLVLDNPVVKVHGRGAGVNLALDTMGLTGNDLHDNSILGCGTLDLAIKQLLVLGLAHLVLLG